MNFELKQFQEDAAKDLADDMTGLMDWYVKRGKPASCCLSAPTGSGKTVIASAVIEGLLNGNTGLGIKRDRDACMLWVTDLPSLSAQTKKKMMDATELDSSLFETISNTFTQNHDMLEPGKVYFIHRQLLSKASLLTKGGETKTFWQVLKETIESSVHLYMFLDEAHRGLGRSSISADADETVYSRLIDGYGGLTPMPVVVGISATPKRFLDAMANRAGRTATDPIRVEPSDVQASGLLKDDIILQSPKTRSAAEALYLGHACQAFDNSTKLWSTWCAANGVQVVKPLMVVQVGDRITDAKLLDLARDIKEKLPWLEDDAYAHVMGDHTDRHLRGFYIPYVSPDEVEQRHEIRILFAKEAISTGWDCPRAEVIFSMRKHTDKTYIAQLLGRMLRTPLARRIDMDALNTVRCYLPLFDATALKEVKDYLTKEDSELGGISTQSGRHVITNPVDVEWNSDLGVDEAFESIVKRIESHHPTNVIEAAYEYASLLARYEIDMSAPKATEESILSELQDTIEVFKSAFDQAVAEVSKIVSIEMHVKYLDAEGGTENTFSLDADSFAISHARDRADHVYTQALTNAFFRAEHIKGYSDTDINVRIAAAASVEDIETRVKQKAVSQLNDLIANNMAKVKEQPEPVRTAFASALSRNGIHRVVNLRRPVRDVQDGDNASYVYHVISNKDSRKAYLDLDAPEQTVVSTELQRGCIAFYRNPSTGTGEHILSVIYQNPSGGHYTMHPDFIFFEKNEDGAVMPSIIDPHGEHYSDALPKMRGLCNYAEEFGDLFERIWCVDGHATQYVNVKDPDTRAYIRESTTADAYMVFKAKGHTYEV